MFITREYFVFLFPIFTNSLLPVPKCLVLKLQYNTSNLAFISNFHYIRLFSICFFGEKSLPSYSPARASRKSVFTPVKNISIFKTFLFLILQNSFFSFLFLLETWLQPGPNMEMTFFSLNRTFLMEKILTSINKIINSCLLLKIKRITMAN